jgi:hypothetical protein
VTRAFALLLLVTTPLVAAPVPKGLKKAGDEDRVLGKWVCESATSGPTEFTTSHKGDVWLFAPPGEKSAQHTPSGGTIPLEYKLLPAGDGLRQVDLALNGNKYAGVYTLDGDALTIAFATLRPASAERAKGVYVFTFRRQTDTK